ncbi:MAG TPA: hypothetical protein VL614_00630 [Acetobacteraceae bacterium]|jgi:hypothetical protein|nr:hypothetical protein [Acetobacteraceae bacterium]
MIARYRFQLFARCPVDKEPDVYDVLVESSRTILCEELLAEAKRIGASEKHMAQEEITCLLARTFAARVTTYGNHGGVITTVVA